MKITPYHLKAYNLYSSTSSTSEKRSLEEAFGVEFFRCKITDIIKSIEDIYSYLGLERNLIIPFKNPLTKQERAINAVFDIQNISTVLNGNWIADWEDSNQPKYYPYFKKQELSGWVVDYYFCVYFFAVLSFGCYFVSSEVALFAGKTFIEIYIDHLPE